LLELQRPFKSTGNRFRENRKPEDLTTYHQRMDWLNDWFDYDEAMLILDECIALEATGVDAERVWKVVATKAALRIGAVPPP
jgi:hypothetical protein